MSTFKCYWICQHIFAPRRTVMVGLSGVSHEEISRVSHVNYATGTTVWPKKKVVCFPVTLPY